MPLCKHAAPPPPTSPSQLLAANTASNTCCSPACLHGVSHSGFLLHAYVCLIACCNSCISLSCLALPCFLHQGVTKQSCFCSFICSLTHQNAFAVFGVVLFWLAGRDQSAAMFDRTDFFMLQGVLQQLHQVLGQGLTEMPSTSAITAMLCPSQVCA